jgi:hypothetical protein
MFVYTPSANSTRPLLLRLLPFRPLFIRSPFPLGKGIRWQLTPHVLYAYNLRHEERNNIAR